MQHDSKTAARRLPVFRKNLLEVSRDYETQTEFAKALGISRQTFGFYIRGDRLPDAAGVKNICEKTGVSADWLVGLPGAPKYPDSTIQGASICTGLDEEAVRSLRRYTDPDLNIMYENNNGSLRENASSRYGDMPSYKEALKLNSIILSLLLTTPDFYRMVDSLREYFIELTKAEAAKDFISSEEKSILSMFDSPGWEESVRILRGESRFMKALRLDALSSFDEAVESIKKESVQIKRMFESKLSGGEEVGKHPEDDK